MKRSKFSENQIITILKAVEAGRTVADVCREHEIAHNFQWRMVQDGVEWFGDTSTNVAVTVTTPPTSTIHWLVTDHLGTPRMIFDQTGLLANVSRHDYLPFGEEVYAGTGGRTTQQGYTGDNVRQKSTGYEHDVETGLDYAEARYYGSAQGRFISSDQPFNDQEEDDPQSWNLYSYVRNNPLIYVDPFGEARWELWDDGQEHYVGDKEGEYDQDLNATWDGNQWNFHEQNGQANTSVASSDESATLMAAGTLTFALSPPPVKTALLITGAAAGAVVAMAYLDRQILNLQAPPLIVGNTAPPPGIRIAGPLPPPPTLRNNSKHNKKIADRLIEKAAKELEKLKSDPPGPGGPRDHHKGEIKAMLERAKRVAERLIGKSKDSRLRKIGEIEKTTNQN